MRIALVVRGGVDRGGRERVTPALLWLIERLAARHALHVFALDYYPEPCSYELLGATVHDVGRVTGPPGLRRARIARRLTRALAHHGPFDVFHAYLGMPAGVVTATVGRRMAVPVVATLDSGEFTRLDDIDYGLQRRWIDRRAVRQMLDDVAAVTVSTGYMAALAAAHGVQPEIVPIGVDARAFPPAERREGPPWRLMRVGSINRVKDYETLLRAVAQLPDSVALDVIGDDTLGGAMTSLADRLGIRSRVVFHGWQPTDRLADFYARAHLNIVSSRHEAANVSVLEASCTGLATVGTSVGYVADWHPERAAAVPVHQPDALAAATLSLLNDVQRRQRLARAARAWALEHDADWTAAAFERIYTRITRS